MTIYVKVQPSATKYYPYIFSRQKPTKLLSLLEWLVELLLQTLTEAANSIEASLCRIVGHDSLFEGDAIIVGIGFLTGLNFDDIAANYSPNVGYKKVLQRNSFVKVDTGVT